MNFFDLIKNHRKIAMSTAVVFLLIFLVTLGFSDGKIENQRKLKLVHVIMRHGARTPASTYPNDPYINYTFFPNGWGQLTNPGKLELYEIGKYIRGRYEKFLGDVYSPKIYESQSTDVDRTKMSAQLVNAAIWIPKNEQKWGPINWQPVPVHYEPLDQDMLLLVRKPCAQYSLEKNRAKNLPEVQEKLREIQGMFQEISNFTGKQMADFDDAEDVYSTLLAEKNFNLTLPSWTNLYFPEKLKKPTTFFYVFNSYTEKMRRLKGGVLLKKLIADWSNLGEKKMFLYVGHDSTISNLLSTLKVFDPQIPGYAITIFLELLQDEKTGEFGVEIFLRNSTKIQPFALKVPGCEKFCPLEKLKNLTHSVIPENWEKECESDVPNYTPPPPAGP